MVTRILPAVADLATPHAPPFAPGKVQPAEPPQAQSENGRDEVMAMIETAFGEAAGVTAPPAIERGGMANHG